MDKKKLIILVVWAIGILLAVGVLSIPDSTVRIKGLGNTNSNISNGGFVAEADGWVYFVDQEDFDKFYKTNGDQVVKLTDDRVSNINVVEDWIFYINISDQNKVYRMKTDGSKKEDLGFRSVNIMVEDGWIYFTNAGDNRRIYRARVNGKDVEKITEKRAINFNLFKEDIIFYELNTGHVYKVPKEKGREVLINDSVTVSRLIVDNNWIYCATRNDNNFEIYKMDLDGQNLQKAVEDFTHLTSQFAVFNDSIYFVSNYNETATAPYNIQGLLSRKSLTTGEIYPLSFFDIDLIGSTTDKIYIKGRELRTIIDFDGKDENYIMSELLAKINEMAADGSLNHYNQMLRRDLVEDQDNVFLLMDNKIVSYDKKTKETKQMVSGLNYNLNMWGDSLYYIKLVEGNKQRVYLTKADGSHTELVVDKDVFFIQIENDILYYMSNDNPEKQLIIYSMDLTKGEVISTTSINDYDFASVFFVYENQFFFAGSELGLGKIKLNGEGLFEPILSASELGPDFLDFYITNNKIIIDNRSILQVDLDTYEIKTLPFTGQRIVSVIDDYIIFTNMNINSLVIFNLDSEKTSILPNRISNAGSFTWMINFSSQFIMVVEDITNYIDYDGRILNSYFGQDLARYHLP